MTATEPKRLVIGAALILVAAGLMPAIFLILSHFGLPFGLGIVPMGEDYNWLIILSGQGLSQKAQNFWAMNDRNPLSPWWYIAAERLYARLPNGPYLTRLLMQPVLGLSAYALILSVTGGRAFGLALAVGMACALGVYANGIDQIHWNFLGAMALSMLCIAAFAMWLSSDRRQVGWYGAALFLWYCAFASYSFQVGAIVGIAVLSWASRSRSADGVGRKLWSSAIEIGPFAFLLLAFVLTWRTMQNPALAGYYVLEPALLLKNLPASLASGLSFSRYLSFARAAVAEFPLLATAVALVIGAVGAGAMMLSRPREGGATISNSILILVIACGLVLPTALIESMSATWGVGMRWPMVDQAWQPLLWLSLVAITIAALPLGRGMRQLAFALCVGAALAGLAAISLGYNRVQLRFAEAERRLSTGLKTAAAQTPTEPLNLIVIVAPDVTLSVPDVMSERISRIWFPGRDVGLRVLVKHSQPGEPGHESWWRVVFGENGAENVKVGGGRSDYASLRVFRFDGHAVTPVEALTAADVAGYPALWQRNSPLSLTH